MDSISHETFVWIFWIAGILICLFFYKFILRFFFGMIIVPENRIGLVTKKFVLFGANKELPPGHIIATKGEAGYQAQSLAPGLYFWMWIWQYEIQCKHLLLFQQGKLDLF